MVTDLHIRRLRRFDQLQLEQRTARVHGDQHEARLLSGLSPVIRELWTCPNPTELFKSPGLRRCALPRRSARHRLSARCTTAATACRRRSQTAC